MLNNKCSLPASLNRPNSNCVYRNNIKRNTILILTKSIELETPIRKKPAPGDPRSHFKLKGQISL